MGNSIRDPLNPSLSLSRNLRWVNQKIIIPTSNYLLRQDKGQHFVKLQNGQKESCKIQETSCSYTKGK